MTLLRCFLAFSFAIVTGHQSWAQTPPKVERTAVVERAAPAFLIADDNRVPLFIHQDGNILRVLDVAGEWYHVEWDDPYYGRRVGFIRKHYIRVAASEDPPVPNSPTQIREKQPLPPGLVAPGVATQPQQSPRDEGPASKVKNNSVSSEKTTLGNHTMSCVAPGDHKRLARVPVYVTAVENKNWFNDLRRNDDSVEDLRKQLADRDGITVVRTREEAIIVLEMLSREDLPHKVGDGRDRQLHVKFIFNGTESDMSAAARGGMNSGGAWGRAAKKISIQVEKWVACHRP